MLFDYDAYGEFIIGILNRICIVRTEQLVKALMNTYVDMSADRAGVILRSLQRDNRLLMSSDGWTVTYGAYLKRTRNKFFDNLVYGMPYRIKEPFDVYVTNDDRNASDLFWIIIDMLPDSIDFMKSSPPWNMLFITKKSEKKKQKLYLLVTIEEGVEHLQIPVLVNNTDYNNENIKDDLRMIALFKNMESFEIADTSLFSYSCVLDNTKDRHFRLVKKN